MASGLPARMVFLCVVLTGALTTHADTERRKVAVVDLSGDPAAGALRDGLYNALLDHWALRPLNATAIDALLRGTLGDEDEQQRIETARTLRDRADAAVLEPNYSSAQTDASDAQKYLLDVTPTPQSVALLADLELARAIADLGLQKPGDAARKFALAARLNPLKTLDPARYVQEIVDAFDAAKKTPTTMTTLEVKGTGRVFIDGKDLGPAPKQLDVIAGDHFVQLGGSDRQTIGIEVTVPRATPVEIADAPASDELMIKRVRLGLSRVPDAAAGSAAMKRLAELLGVHDAALIAKNDDGKLTVQTWRDHECPICPSPDPGFSAIRIYHNEKPIDLLAPLSPPRPPEPERQIPFLPPPVAVENQWYEKRWVQGSIAGGTIAAIVGAILWARHQSYVSLDHNPQWFGISR